MERPAKDGPSTSAQARATPPVKDSLERGLVPPKKPDTLVNPKNRWPKAGLPGRGEPGGVDDPYRKEMNGSRTKWYLRYLSQGLSRDEARTRTLERPAGPSPAELKKSAQQPKVAKKRGNQTLTPPTPTPAKRRQGRPLAPTRGSSTAGGSSYANAVKQVKVAVLPVEYPQITLTHEELTELEDAILLEVAKGWSHKIMFDGVHFRSGMLLIDCADDVTADWLVTVVPGLASWKGPPLTARTGEDIPSSHFATIYLPRSEGQTQDHLLALIDAQNEGLNVPTWKVLSLKTEGKGQLMVVGIDEMSRNAIVEADHTLRYRFGRIPVRGLKKQRPEEHEKPAPVEDTNLSTEKISESQEPMSSQEITEEMELEQDGDQTLVQDPTTSDSEFGEVERLL